VPNKSNLAFLKALGSEKLVLQFDIFLASFSEFGIKFSAWQ